VAQLAGVTMQSGNSTDVNEAGESDTYNDRSIQCSSNLLVWRSHRMEKRKLSADGLTSLTPSHWI